MRRTATIALAAFLFAADSLAQSPEKPTLLSHGEINYPPIARVAHVEGNVTISFIIDAQGVTTDVSSKSGPAMLQGVAIDAVKSWRFSPPPHILPTEAIFHFMLNPPPDGYNDVGPSDTAVELRSLEEIQVIGVKTIGLYRDHCPSPEERLPPENTGAADFVELFRGACMGSCPTYTVRVYRDGRVTWEGGFVAAVKGKAKSQIPLSDAATLLQRFQSPVFWQLCSSYSSGTTDSATTGMTVVIGGREKVVSEYAGSAPQFFLDLEKDVDATANTHRWRHGNPLTEPLDDIEADSYYAKPGVTELMLAASSSSNLEDLKRLVASAADVNATDSSGWTPLMFAASSESSLGIQALLKAGATPNHQSPHGDTALMVSALYGFIDEDLLAGGAKINLQNKDGTTALMFLTLRADPDEIKTALDHGADANLRDKNGRTALDYLYLASCSKSPIRLEPQGIVFGTRSNCTTLRNDDAKRAAALLEAAMRHPNP